MWEIFLQAHILSTAGDALSILAFWHQAHGMYPGPGEGVQVGGNWKCTWSTLHASTDKNYTKLWQKWALYSFKYLPMEGLTLNRMVFKQLYKVNCCIPHLRPWVPREGLANKWFTLAQPSKIMQYKHRKHHHNSNSDLICITMSGWMYMAGMVRILRADSATFQASQLHNSLEVLFWGMCQFLKALKCYL